METTNTWRHCGSCKKPIVLNSKYLACTISTCNKTVYCSMPCFDIHVPVFRHKDAWAEERFSPKNLETLSNKSSLLTTTSSKNNDVLIIASKLKDYIKNKADMNTSANVMDRLSDIVRRHCDNAINKARQDGRKTVMDRDFLI